MKLINKKIINLTKSEILFGIHPVTLALEANKRQFIKLFVKKSFVVKPRQIISNILQLAKEKKYFVSLNDNNLLDKLSNNGQHQGICMEVSKYKIHMHDFKETLDNKVKLCVALESIYDPMNFGSIIRTCNFLGFDEIIISDTNCCELSPVVSKASSGAMEISRIQIEYKKRNWNIIGTSQNSSTKLHEFSTNKSSIIIFGNEGTGLSQETLNLCDNVISIKMSSSDVAKQVDCLNVNVAAGIVLHHLRHSKFME